MNENEPVRRVGKNQKPKIKIELSDIENGKDSTLSVVKRGKSNELNSKT